MKAKKIIISILIVVACVCCLCSCSRSRNKDKDYFSQSVLQKALVPDLPKISYTKSEKLYSKMYKFQSTEEDFNSYVAEVYTYLTSLEFEYFGYRGEELNSLFGASPTYAFYESTELSDFKYTVDRAGNELENCYVFVWANDIYENNNLKDKYYLELNYYSDRDFNVCIDLNFCIEGYRLITE